MAKGPHYRITFGGVFGTVAAATEAWQTSVNMDTDAPASPLDEATLVSRAQTHLTNFETRIKPVLQANVNPTYCDIRLITLGGLQPRGADGSFQGAGRYDKPDPTPSGTTGQYPNQIACVATLLTARQGPTGKGRMFLPPPAAAIGSDGRMSASQADAIAAAVAGLLSDINSAWVQNLSVMSSYGFASTITGVRVGRVLDTHRSRRSNVPEQPGAVVAVTQTP